jgi:CRISPR-associated protein Csh2
MADTDGLRRSEILFVYDVADANPNGDPNDENRPRMDPDTGKAKVSDVRIKRTIRDYLDQSCGEEILCKQIEREDGSIQTGKQRAEDFLTAKNAKNVLEKRDAIKEQILKTCIDARLFGATLPVEKVNKNEKGSSVTLTGPVQFAMGSTLHRAIPVFVKGTGAFASSEGAQQKTFREEWILPYALIATYGIVNQNAASSTRMTVDDAEKLFKALWFGTKNLITRSKIGHRPLFLLIVEYTEPDAYIGRLDRLLSLEKRDGFEDLRDEELRDASQVRLDLSGLKKELADRKGAIRRLRYAWDQRLELSDKPAGDSFFELPAKQLFK